MIKCDLITKEEFLHQANRMFLGLDVDVIGGHRVLGSIIGSVKSCNNLMKEKVQLKKLAKHSKVSPQNLYKSFTNGV